MPSNSLSELQPPLVELRQLLEEQYNERKVYTYISGESIRMEPQEVWVVCRGVVLLSTFHSEGDEVLLGLAGPSMPFGKPLSLLTSYYATAMTDVNLLRLTLKDLDRSPVLAQSILHHLSRRLRQTEAILAVSGHRRAEARLRHLLSLLKTEVGQPTATGTRLDIRLTHQQLANAIGTTRVTITRLLGKLRDEQWINMDATRHIVVSTRAVSG